MNKTTMNFKGIEQPSWCYCDITSRPATATPKLYATSLPTSNYELDFSDVNTDEVLHYENRIISVEITFKAETKNELNSRISHIANWLSGKGNLIFSDYSNRVWEANVIQQIVPNITRFLNVTKMEVFFKCYPFPRSLNEITFYTGSTNGVDYTTVNINNAATSYTYPIIKIENNDANLSEVNILQNGKVWEYSSPFSTIILNCEKKLTTDDCGIYLSGNASGKYPILKVGSNILHIMTDIAANIEIKGYYRYIY